MSSDGLPLSSVHGELAVGSVSPSVKFSLSFVAVIDPPNLTLCGPRAYAKSTLTPIVGELAVLAGAARRVRERVRARVIGDLVVTDEAVGRHQEIRAEDACVARRDVEGGDLLVLILPERVLVVGVGHVE